MLRLRDDEGSAPAEFAMVAGLLVMLVLGVMQLGLAMLVRNTLADAAAEGARFAALADNVPADGVARTVDLIETALGPAYAQGVTVSTGDYLGHPAVAITVRSPLPLIGLVGLPEGLEVTGHAAVETLD